MRTTIVAIVASLAVVTTACIAVAASNPLEAFPTEMEGMKRIVIDLPKQDDETLFKVELVPGAVQETDGVNIVRHGSSLLTKTLNGWGYNYYVANNTGLSMSTLMAAPSHVKPVKKFVAGSPVLIRYNSKLPIVIYAPEDIKIKHRVWTTDSEWTLAH